MNFSRIIFSALLIWAVQPFIASAETALSQENLSAEDCSSAYKGQVGWNASLYGFGSTKESLPFWMTTNRHGIFPEGHGGILSASADLKYSTKPSLDIYSGVSLVGNAVPGRFSGFVDRLYFSLGWKKLRLDLGMLDRSDDFFNGLSLTGGNIMLSGNARNFPGYNFRTDYIVIPGTKGVFAFKANYADYKLLDKRYVEGQFLHNVGLTLRFSVHRRVDIYLGIEMWSQWAGVLPETPTRPRMPQPSSFKDYIRVVLGMKGGSNATVSDQINVLGNHLGRELIRVDWKADAFTMIFQHDIPFEDGSGMGFQNFPDGVNSLCFSLKDRKFWVTDVLYEYTYTKWQSGKVHDRPPTEEELIKNPDKDKYIVGGCDEYFNNGEYRSGWTHFGRTLGLPLFTPVPTDENGLTLGVFNNRVESHHLGVAGVIARLVPYKFKFTYTKNFGTYHKPLSGAPEQFSMALEATLPKMTRVFPVAVSLGAYCDVGKFLPESFGLTLSISYSGSAGFARR